MAAHTYLLLLIFVSIEYAMMAPSRETGETADKCPPLSDLANGTFTVRNQTVTYKCNHGFVMVGEMKVHCNGTHWSSNPPQCLRRRRQQQQQLQQQQQQQQQSKTTRKPSGRKRSSTVHSITVRLIQTKSTTLSPTSSTTPRVENPKKMSALSLTATSKLPTATTTARATNQMTSTTLSPTSSTTPRVEKPKKMSALWQTATSKLPTATTTARATNQTTSTTLSPTSSTTPRVEKPKKVSTLSQTATSKLPTATTTARATTETTSTTLSPTTTLRIETTSSTVLPTTTTMTTSSPTTTEKSPTVRLATPTTYDESTDAAIIDPTLTQIPGDPSASEPAAGHLKMAESTGAVEHQLDASTTDAATDVELQSLTGTSTPQGDAGMDYSSVERDADRDAMALDNFRTRSTYQIDTDDRSSSSDDTGNDVTTNRADAYEEKLQTTDIDDDLNETTAPSVGETSAKVSSVGLIEDLESPDVVTMVTVTMVTTKTDDVIGGLASAAFSSMYLTNDEGRRSSLIDQDPMTDSITPTSSSAEGMQPITTSGLSDELPDSSFVTQPPFEPVEAYSTDFSTASIGFSANPSIISGRRSPSVLEASGASTQFPGSSDAGRLSMKIVLYSTYPSDGSMSRAAELLTSSPAAVAHEISSDLTSDDSPAASRRLPSATTTSSLSPVVRSASKVAGKSAMTNDNTLTKWVPVLILIVALTAVVCLVVIVAVIWLSRRRPKTQTAVFHPNEITAELRGFKNAEKETRV